MYNIPKISFFLPVEEAAEVVALQGVILPHYLDPKSQALKKSPHCPCLSLVKKNSEISLPGTLNHLDGRLNVQHMNILAFTSFLLRLVVEVPYFLWTHIIVQSER